MEKNIENSDKPTAPLLSKLPRVNDRVRIVDPNTEVTNEYLVLSRRRKGNKDNKEKR